MKTHAIIIVTVISLIACPACAQVYDQSDLIRMMPRIPTSVIGVDDDAKEMFRAQITSLETHLDSLMSNYRHPMCPIEKSSQHEMFEFDRIWEELYRLNDRVWDDCRSKTMAQTEQLAQTEFDRQAGLSEELRRIKQESKTTMKDTGNDENRIDKAMYDNHATANQKRADWLTRCIMSYTSVIENYAAKVKRADTILLAELSGNHNYPCAAIFNARRLLDMYKGYIELFIPPYTPKFE